MTVARGVALAGCLLVGWATRADEAHDRLQTERAAADARHRSAERGCASRFVVSSCLEAARAEHRAALADLRNRELELDDRERRAVSVARAQAIEAKRAIAEQAAATRAHTAVSPSAASAVRPTGHALAEAPALDTAGSGRPASPRPGHLFPAPSTLPKPAGPTTGAARVAHEREREAAYDARTAQIAAHRAEVLRRNAERAAGGKSAAPLPPASVDGRWSAAPAGAVNPTLRP